MAVWTEDDDADDARLAGGTFTTAFHNPEYLAETVSRLRLHGYRTVELDAAAWPRTSDFHTDISAALDFPDYYGRNLDALNDCLGDVVEQQYGWAEPDTGLVLVIHHFDHFVRTDKQTAEVFVDAWTSAGVAGALIGNRLLCLIQSDDPRLVLPRSRPEVVPWNGREWLRANRGI
jgi:hypothetical protein